MHSETSKGYNGKANTMSKTKKEPKCLRVVKIECETATLFRHMCNIASANPNVAGARLGALGEFFVTDESRFRFLKEAHGAKELA